MKWLTLIAMLLLSTCEVPLRNADAHYEGFWQRGPHAIRVWDWHGHSGLALVLANGKERSLLPGLIC